MPLDVQHHCFDDFDRLREHLVGWDTEPIQLTPGRLRLRWDQLAMEGCNLARLRTNLRIADRMAIEADTVHFVVCLARKRFCGMDVQPGSLVVFGAGREYRSVLEEGWESVEITLPRIAFDESGIGPQIDQVSRLGPERSVYALPEPMIAAWRDLGAALSEAQPSVMSGVDERMWSDALRSRAVALLADGLAEGRGGDIGALHRARSWCYPLATRALEHLQSAVDTPATIGTVAARTGTSVRAVQHAFKEALGVSPFQFQLAFRLDRARRHLLDAAHNDDSVTGAAIDAGFNHFGRFAQQYRRMFGERPSETLRRARAAASGQHA